MVVLVVVLIGFNDWTQKKNSFRFSHSRNAGKAENSKKKINAIAS